MSDLDDYLDEGSRLVFENSSDETIREMGEVKNLSPNYENGIPVAKFKNRPGYLKLNIKPVTVIGFFGPSGSGKTTGMNAVACRAYDDGRNLVNMADTDLQFNNYKNSPGAAKPLIESMGLYENESRHTIPAKTLMPKFIYDELLGSEMFDDPPTFVETFSFGFHQVSRSELKSLLTRGLDKKQSQKVESLLNDVTVNQDLSFDKLRTALEEADFHGSAKKPIETNIDNLDDSNLISSRNSHESRGIVEYLNDDYILSIGMKNLDMVLSEDDMWMAEFYSRKVLEIIIEARISGELEKKLLGVIPEAHHLIPAGKGSELASKLKRNFTYYKRRTDFPFMLDTQSPYQLPGRDDDKDILGEINCAFIGRGEEGKTLEPKGFQKILKSMNIVTQTNRDFPGWAERLKDVGWREFLFVKPGMSDPHDAPIIEFLSPLVSNP